jgi:hypothetical protein
MVWALPGFVTSVGGPAVNTGWYHMYQISFFVGYALSGGIFWALNMLFPPPGLGEQVDFDVQGVPAHVETTEMVIDEKAAVKSESTVVWSRSKLRSIDLTDHGHNVIDEAVDVLEYVFVFV